jgi:hypothetical protein
MAAEQGREALARAGADSVYGYLERTAETGPEGVRWQTFRDPDAPQYTPQLYGGVAGITLFLSDYFRLTGVTAARELARRALEWCGTPGHPPERSTRWSRVGGWAAAGRGSD